MDRRSMMIGTALSAVFAAARALPHSADSSQRLNALFDQFMKENLDLSPLFVTSLGLDTGERAKQKSEVDQGSEAAIARQKALTASQLARLQGLGRAGLSSADAVSYDVVMYGLRTNDAANKAFQYGPGGAGQPYVVCQLNGSYQQLPSFLDNQHTIETKADADAYIARLAGFARLLDQETEVARHDLAMGVVPPDFALAKTLTQMQTLRAPAPEKSSLTTSVVRRTREKSIPGDYLHPASRVVKDQVYPALERQMALVVEMQKRATHDAGAWHLPDGEAYYSASLVSWATTSKKPDEIHRLGLEVVKDNTARIDTLMRKLGMTQGIVGARLRAMFMDPKYLYANTDAAKDSLLADLNARVQRVRAKLPRYFGALPKANVEIKRVPKEIEAGAPRRLLQQRLARWKAPRHLLDQPARHQRAAQVALPTLTYHESIPGHHLQLSIQQEAQLPLIRKVAFFSAYIEGWALYAEQLAGRDGRIRRRPVRAYRPAARFDVPRGAAGGRHRHAQQALDARAGGPATYVDTLGDPGARPRSPRSSATACGRDRPAPTCSAS